MSRPLSLAWLGALAGLSLAACGTLQRTIPTAAQMTASPAAAVLDHYRIPADDDAGWVRWVEAWTVERRALGLDGVRALAMSGGGANGAYGAGVLVGWSESGARPTFDFVTGVSTGALMAPLAFVGPDWDQRLTAAYHDGEVRALARNDFGFLSNPSLKSGRTLERLVTRYVDADLVSAIAQRHREGARLLVATTNLDTQRGIIWDLGAIAVAAQQPGQMEGGLSLIRSILIASASLPGVFPPHLLEVDAAEGLTEMHVDGGVTAPFFFVPETMYLWRPPYDMRPVTMHLIINGQIGGRYDPTGGGLSSILQRTADTLGRADARTQIRIAQTFAMRNDVDLAVTVIPDEEPADPLMFEPGEMRRLFDLGRTRARSGDAFRLVQRPLDCQGGDCVGRGQR